MAYGVTCSSLLLSFGYSPAAARASVRGFLFAQYLMIFVGLLILVLSMRTLLVSW